VFAPETWDMTEKGELRQGKRHGCTTSEHSNDKRNENQPDQIIKI